MDDRRQQAALVQQMITQKRTQALLSKKPVLVVQPGGEPTVAYADRCGCAAEPNTTIKAFMGADSPSAASSPTMTAVLYQTGPRCSYPHSPWPPAALPGDPAAPGRFPRRPREQVDRANV